MSNPSAIVDFGTLSDAVGAYLVDQDIETSDIALFIQLLESDLEQSVRLDLMVTTEDGELVGGTQNLAQPADFCEMINFYVTQNRPVILEYRDPRSFYSTGFTEIPGFPRQYTRIGATIPLSPTPDSNYAYRLTYYAKVERLNPIAPTSTNDLLLLEPNLYLFGTLKKATQFFDDTANEARWSRLFDETLSSLHSADARARYRPGVRERAVMVDDSAWRQGG